MKKLLTLALVFVIGATCASAQTQKEINKENRARDRYTEQKVNEKASKAARKEAKKLTKEGWIVSPGSLPLEKQLDRAFNMQYDEDQDGPIYITGFGQSTGEHYDAAKMQAIELAKLQIAGMIETNIASIIESTIANQQIAEGDAASLVETVQASKNIISQKLGRVVPVVECYRDVKKKKEVLVRLTYNRKQAMNTAKECIREELKKKGDKLHEELDNVLGF